MRIFFVWLTCLNFVLPTFAGDTKDNFRFQLETPSWYFFELTKSFNDRQPPPRYPKPIQKPDLLAPFHHKAVTINTVVVPSSGLVSDSDHKKELLHQQCDVIFEKLRQAVEEKLLPAHYAIGADWARSYIHLRIDYPNLDQPVPELTAMAQEILASLGADVLMTIEDQTLLSWNTFRELVTEMVNRKNNNDIIYAVKDLDCEYQKKDLIEKFTPKVTLQRPGMPEVFAAFITTPDGILGEAIFLITIAFDVALFGVPTEVGFCKADNKKYTTAGFVDHDLGHVINLLSQLQPSTHVKAPISKFDIIRSGRFRNFLTKVAYTEVNIRGLFSELRENEFSPSHFWGENPDYGILFFKLCLDPNTELSNDQIAQIINANKDCRMDYGHAPFFGKHAAGCSDAKAYITGQKAPSTELLKKMKSWDILHNPKGSQADFLSLVSMLERADDELWHRIDEAHALQMLSNITVNTFYDFIYIRFIIDLFERDFEQVKRRFSENRDAILQQYSWEGRYRALKVG